MDKKMTSYKSRPASSKPSDPSCVICFKTQSISSIGACDHPVCYECSTTMRVLCDQKECPICRRILTKVIFTKEVDLFKNLESRQYSRYNKKYGIAFNDHSVEYSFEQLLRCYCKKCYDRPDFVVFEQLVAHMERNHRLYACRLCVKHLKIFPSQRRWYNYDELTRHEECGDPDNTSHRGHPQCHFCSIRYLDKDELYKHLRKEHFYCHFCDADGIQDYYMSYEWLRKHYHDKHYLCEEGNCVNEQFTSVFRSSIDLQAHKAQMHSKELGKHGSKEIRTIKLEFNLRPRHNPTVEAGRPNLYQPPPDNSYHAVHQSDINVRNTSDFPSLNGQHTTVLPCARTRKQNQSVNTQDLNSFPALGQEQQQVIPVKPQPKPANSIRMAAVVMKKPPELQKPDKNNKDSSGSRLPNQAKDFPSLDGNQQQTSRNREVTPSVSSSSGGSWVSKAKTANEKNLDEKKKNKKEPAAIKKKIAEAPKVPGPSDFPNLNKKLEPTKSNLAKLGNKKKMDNSKKNSPPDNHHSNNNQNIKKNSAVHADSENANNSKKATENIKSTVGNNKENNKPKAKCIDTVQFNGASDVTKPSSTVKTTAKTELNTEPKKESQKKNKGNGSSMSVLLIKSGETTTDSTNNNQKDKKKRKKNENKELENLTESNSIQRSHENNSYDHSLKLATPKIPPGFENQSFHQNHNNHNMSIIRAPPGLTNTGGNENSSTILQTTRIKAPPGLSLITPNGKAPQEYTHPVGTTFRNQVLINNLMEALVSVQDGHLDTFEKFKEMSTLFRKHLITAYDFYSYCVEALCPRSFETIFLELVLLLPDIQKQQELLFIYNRNHREEMNVEICKYCHQVLRTIDMEHHMSVHTNTHS